MSVEKCILNDNGSVVTIGDRVAMQLNNKAQCSLNEVYGKISGIEDNHVELNDKLIIGLEQVESVHRLNYR